MTRSVALCLLCLLLAAAVPGGGPISAHGREVEQRQQDSSSRNLNSPHEHLHTFIALTNTTNTTNATTTSPTPATPPAPSEPTPPPTHSPTKKYVPSDDDEENRDEEQKQGTRVGIIFLWVVVIFAAIWGLCYFRDPVVFFFLSAWTNTRRYGCKGCLHSFFPCFFGSLPDGGESALDQIIFETEDPNAPLMT